MNKLEESVLIENFIDFCEQENIDIYSLTEQEINELLGQMLTNFAAGKGFRTDAGVERRNRSTMMGTPTRKGWSGGDANARRMLARASLAKRGFKPSVSPADSGSFNRTKLHTNVYGKVPPQKGDASPSAKAAPAPAPQSAPTPAPAAAPAGPAKGSLGMSPKAIADKRMQRMDVRNRLATQAQSARKKGGGAEAFMQFRKNQRAKFGGAKGVQDAVRRGISGAGKQTVFTNPKSGKAVLSSTELFGDKIVERFSVLLEMCGYKKSRKGSSKKK